MAKHIQREIEHLKERLISFSETVEQRVKLAIEAFSTQDAEKAKAVIAGDQEIDILEVEVEEECLKILALYQPVAVDLRLVVSILKMNNDLERIGDVAVNIAQRVERLCEIGAGEIPSEIEEISKKVKLMLRKSLLSLVEMDTEIARGVLVADAQVDEIHSHLYKNMLEAITKDPSKVEQKIIYISVSKQLERIADLTCNIAEDVVYTSEGDIVRHGRTKDRRSVKVRAV